MRAYLLQVRGVDECITVINILAVANILYK